MSFRISLKAGERGAARFSEEVRVALEREIARSKAEDGLTASKIADALGLHRSVLSKEKNGRRSIAVARLGQVGEITGHHPKIVFEAPVTPHGANVSTTKIYGMEPVNFVSTKRSKSFA